MTKKRTPATLELISTGFLVHPIGTVDWAKIVEITRYKTDNLTTDEIWIEYRMKDGRTIPISEEWFGFEEVVRQMTVLFPSTAAWHAALSQPAFHRCETVLFSVEDSMVPKEGKKNVGHAAPSGEA